MERNQLFLLIETRFEIMASAVKSPAGFVVCVWDQEANSFAGKLIDASVARVMSSPSGPIEARQLYYYLR